MVETGGSEVWWGDADTVVILFRLCGGGAFSLSPTVDFIRSRLSFRFKQASLPRFCCSVSSSSSLVCVAVCFLVRQFDE